MVLQKLINFEERPESRHIGHHIFQKFEGGPTLSVLSSELLAGLAHDARPGKALRESQQGYLRIALLVADMQDDLTAQL